ncbi:hypothetical protein K1567_10080 [Pseudomonas sp. S5F11]|uniref:hypothetical protein n=1 Tax=Pseudomonas sp. S5F11 TaxID=2866385 RepID=UPI001C7CB0E2|nr:hypothetical protein [Pseudomonas sp. S5F11]MBX4136267.1 hypothetical protein [Pseudomonas sp. S5F11]
MKIKLFPFLTNDLLEASVKGDVITINRETIDLSGIPAGYRLPGSAVGNRFFLDTDYIERVDGVLNFTLLLPVHWDSPEESRNPAEPIIIDIQSGAVPFPDTTPPIAPIVELPTFIEEPENGGFEPA